MSINTINRLADLRVPVLEKLIEKGIDPTVAADFVSDLTNLIDHDQNGKHKPVLCPLSLATLTTVLEYGLANA